MKALTLGSLSFATMTLIGGSALADPVENFYRGKTLTVVVGFTAGGDYDLRARFIVPYLARHLPGHPSVVVQNMTGGAGIIAANWVANVAPRDGTVLLAMASPAPIAQAIKQDGVAYDVRAFNWIGNSSSSPNVITSWAASGVTEIKQVMEKEFVVGASGRGSGSYYYPISLNRFAGTKFKVVSGYPGGSDINLAMERGEVAGRGSNSWASWKSTKPEWLAQKKIHILVQVGQSRDPELPDVPLMQDLATGEKEKAILRFLSLDTTIARPLVTTPGVPTDRVAALRRAFDQAMKDPELLAEAEKRKLDMDPLSGEEAQKIAAEIANTEPDVVAAAKSILVGK